MAGSDYSKDFQLTISNDEMSAYLFLVPPNTEEEPQEDDFEIEIEAQKEYSVEEIIGFLKQNGVIYGIRDEEIKQLIEDKNYGVSACVAEGTAPTEGKNGYFDFKIDLNASKNPKILENGNVDYYNLNMITTVCKGDLLVVYVPKVDGIDGTTVTGKPKKADVCKDLPPLKGKGFVISEDGLIYTAECEGKVDDNNGRLTVSQLYTISGDIDLSTGNIDVRGCLEITGTVRAGMSVKTTGSVTINGCVESATVEAGKDIMIRGGIVGGSKAYVSAGGDLFAQFIEMAQVKAGRNIQADSILNSYVTAGMDVIVLGRKGTIVGGKVKADHIIRAGSLGSLAYVRTEIETGIDKFIEMRLSKLKQEIEEAKEELDKLNRAAKLAAKREINDVEVNRQIMRLRIEKSALIKRSEQEVRAILKSIENAQGTKVVVEGYVYPNVYIKIGSSKIRIEEEYKDIEFVNKGSQVLSKNASGSK